MSARITTAQVHADTQALAAQVADLTTAVTALTGVVTRMAGNALAYTPAAVATAVPTTATVSRAPEGGYVVAIGSKRKAPAKARIEAPAIASGDAIDQDGALLCKSYAVAEALASKGVLEARLLVPAGKLGKDGWQTFAEATAKREARTLTRESYLAGKERMRVEGEATSAHLRERKASKAARPSVVVIDAEGTPVSVAAPANPMLGRTGAELRTMAEGGTKAERKAAQAEIARRAAKRASKRA